MTRIVRSLGLAALACMPTAALTAEGIDPAKVCPRGEADQPAIVDPVALVYQAIASAGPLQAGIFDADGDGNETAGERLAALFSPTYCRGTSSLQGHEATRCGKGDQATLDIAQMNLRNFLDRHVDITLVAEPSASDIKDRPLLGSTEYGAYVRALDERRRFSRIECKPRSVTADLPQPPHRIRISNTVEGLSLRRGTPSLLAAVPQAELSYVDDKVADSSTTDVSVVIGYELSRSAETTLLPYLEARHKRVSGEDADTDADTKKWGAGFVYGRVFESLDEISIAPHYAIDRSTDAEFAVLKAAWAPGFLLNIDQLPFGGSREYRSFAWKLDARLLTEVGKVFEVGTSEISEDDANYVRSGPALSATVWLLSDNVILSRLSLDARYKNLVRIDGPGPLIRFSAGINYSPEKTDHFSLRLSYDQGKEDDTLKRVEGWKLSFGVRY
ncbi:hypothetical protein LDO26_00820 [Luteimonas sp. BDR2-5]|uniref:hypothetical protein n=1 Tax=Proluteimonas luteida TaxID=2878685 RepID=UPI001E36EF16|nr:hypothetical protein [Luteimonas sp. BDR2-5]MCD9026757.1 hypothetical protein [Luteimonas sp. BDR2-5]